MDRRRKEITKTTKLAVFRRAGGPEDLHCEGCGLALKGKPFDYHHTFAEWRQALAPRDRPPITPDEVKLLGKKCCHDDISSTETTERTKGLRVIEKAARARERRGPPMPGSRRSKWKRLFNGTVVLR